MPELQITFPVKKTFVPKGDNNYLLSEKCFHYCVLKLAYDEIGANQTYSLRQDPINEMKEFRILIQFQI